MPMLSCSAITCVFNKEELCARGDISVGGQNARTSDETCCESFRERTSGEQSNSEGCGCKTIAVDCQACHCVYNEDCRCDAAKIGIGGASASTPQETMCGTFQCK